MTSKRNPTFKMVYTLIFCSFFFNCLVFSIPFCREVYKYAYSSDGSLTGYVNNSLAYFNVEDFSEMAIPRDPFLNLPYNKSFCRSVYNPSTLEVFPQHFITGYRTEISLPVMP